MQHQQATAAEEPSSSAAVPYRPQCHIGRSARADSRMPRLTGWPSSAWWLPLLAGIRHRPLDPCARGHCDQTAHWGRLPPGHVLSPVQVAAGLDGRRADAPIFVKSFSVGVCKPTTALAMIALMPRRRRGRALDGRSRLRTIRSAHHDIERRPRWTHAQSAEECASCSLPIRELVARIPAPGGDHGKNKGSALAQQVLISVGIALAHIFGDMSEVELDRSTATRLEIDEQQSGLRAEHVAWVRLAAP